MDGTLFDAPGHVPIETYGLVRELKEHGIHFAASSGRRLEELTEPFGPVFDEMDFVCSNGAEVYVGGKLIDREIFSHDALLRLGEVVNQFDNLHLLAHASSVTYCFDPPQKYEHLPRRRTPTRDLMLDETPGPEVHIYNGVIMCEDRDLIPDIVYALGVELGDVWTFAWTGGRGIDYMPKNVSKSNGIRKLIRHYLLTPDEVMVYGDSMNDYDILRYVGHPVVMGNGLYGVKQIAERVIETNKEHGVQKDIRRLLDELDGKSDTHPFT
jgi:Cof subfamily protein (haloacid dehalogenase superfamily)